MNPRKPGSIQARVIQLLPCPRAEVVSTLCRTGGFHSSATYRAINSLLKRGVISIDEYGVITRVDV